MKRLFLVLTVFLAFLITGCDDNPTDGDKYENRCTTAGVNECNEEKLMVCQQNEDGSLVLVEVEICENGCEDGACVSLECDPACEEWQSCNNGTCETGENRCTDNNDCEDGKICDETHNCIIEELKKKTKVVIGAGKKVSSSSFKMRLNVGKVTSTKDLKSESYKMKVGTSVIYK